MSRHRCSRGSSLGSDIRGSNICDLEVRLTKALPWVLASYPDADWSWLIDQVKLKDAQNRLGFVVGLAQAFATSLEEFQSGLQPLAQMQAKLERAARA